MLVFASLLKAKTIFFKGGRSLALTREKKQEVLSRYEEWLSKSEAVVLTEYSGMTMPDFDALRAKVREAGGEFHVLKNTIGKRAFTNAGYEDLDEFFNGSTAIGIAFDDPPGVAKAIKDFGKKQEALVIKGGFFGKDKMSAVQMNTMAELPPLPVVRAMLLGTISAPASKLVRTVAEPGRSLAQVIKAHAEASA
jgi:large subunit ribosomal protein L10